MKRPQPTLAAIHLPLLAAGGLAAFGLAACNQRSVAGSEETPGRVVRREATRVRTAPVVQREMIRTLQTSTEVQSEKEIEIVPRTSGVVTEILVEEGDRVAEGQVLARLDQREAQATLDDLVVAEEEAQDNIEKARIARLEAEAMAESTRLGYEKAVRDFERNEKTGLISATELDTLRLQRDTTFGTWQANKLALERNTYEERAAQTAARRAKLARERQDLALSYTEITAPFAGEIARRMCKVGDAIGASETVFVLTDAEDLRVVFMRPQRELMLFAGGATNGTEGGGASASVEITARPEALPGTVFRGEIERLSPSIDTDSGAFRVTARLTQPPRGSGEPRLLPGMLVRLSIVTDRHPEALVVPKRSVRREGESLMIFVVREGRAERVRVLEGYSDDDHVEVLPLAGETLAAGERVVVVGNRDLEDGDEVEDEAAPKEPEVGSEPAAAGAGSAGADDAEEIAEGEPPPDDTAEAEARGAGGSDDEGENGDRSGG